MVLGCRSANAFNAARGQSVAHVAIRQHFGRGRSEPPACEREPAAALVDPFKGAVLEMLRDDASEPATVIREHLQREGCDGGITILKDYLASVRQQLKATPDFGRTAYLPGELLQTD